MLINAVTNILKSRDVCLCPEGEREGVSIALSLGLGGVALAFYPEKNTQSHTEQ